MLSKTLPKSGKILISEPFMLDPQFRRSVVLIVEHGEEGTVGFVLNQETEVTLPDIIPGFPLFDARIRVGGPVQTDTLHFIHRIPEMVGDGVEIETGIFWGGNFEQMKELISIGKIQMEDVMFFLGYSGWSPGQLEQELKTNSWIVADTESGIVFNEEHDNLWKETIRLLGNKYAHIANFPENPMWN